VGHSPTGGLSFDWKINVISTMFTKRPHGTQIYQTSSFQS